MRSHDNFWAFVLILIFVVVLIYFGIILPTSGGLLRK